MRRAGGPAGRRDTTTGPGTPLIGARSTGAPLVSRWSTYEDRDGTTGHGVHDAQQHLRLGQRPVVERRSDGEGACADAVEQGGATRRHDDVVLAREEHDHVVALAYGVRRATHARLVEPVVEPREPPAQVEQVQLGRCRVDPVQHVPDPVGEHQRALRQPGGALDPDQARRHRRPLTQHAPELGSRHPGLGEHESRETDAGSRLPEGVQRTQGPGEPLVLLRQTRQDNQVQLGRTQPEGAHQPLQRRAEGERHGLVGRASLGPASQVGDR